MDDMRSSAAPQKRANEASHLSHTSLCSHDLNMVFFFHNPKAAGTAISTFLKAHFRPARTCPLIENNRTTHDSLGGDYQAYSGHDFYAGHYGRDIYDGVGCNMPRITNFRSPPERIRSLYNYFRYNVSISDVGDKQYSAVLSAKSMSFRDFVASDDPEIEIYLHDYHFRQLSHSGWDRKIRTDLRRVEEYIDDMLWYYVCEEPRLSNKWGALAFELEGFSLPMDNVGIHADSGALEEEISSETLMIIKAKNALDCHIYKYARRLLKARLN